MFIVKKKSEILRFGIFVALMGAMAYFVATRVNTWRTSMDPESAGPPAAQTQGSVQGAQTAGLMEMMQGKADGEDFFADYRIKRDQERDTLRESLREVLNSPNTDADVKKQASAQLMELSRTGSLESQTETMLKARGFDDAIVYLATGSAHVVVKAKQLDDQQALQVLETVRQITKVSPTAINVMARER